MTHRPKSLKNMDAEILNKKSVSWIHMSNKGLVSRIYILKTESSENSKQETRTDTSKRIYRGQISAQKDVQYC